MRQGERTDIEPSANLRKVGLAEAAKMMNVSTRLVETASMVKREAPDLHAKVKAGEMTRSG